jgi:hypothetical protein
VTLELSQAPEGVNACLYGRLVEAARAGAILSYTDVGKPLNLDFENPADRTVITRSLGEISRYEVSQGRPMLSSLVWHKDLSGLGVGLRNLGVELGIVLGDEDDLAFATRQVNATHAYWRGR